MLYIRYYAFKIHTPEVKLYYVEVSNHHRRFRCGFLIIIKPLAAQSLRLVPYLQQIFIILHDNSIFIKLTVHIWLGATPVLNTYKCVSVV